MTKNNNLLTAGYRSWPLLAIDEQKAVRRLARALKGWPQKRLGLFGWSGVLVVKLIVPEDTRGAVVSAASIADVHADGGDPYEYDGPLRWEDDR